MFRIGGDELLALCAGIEHAALMERIGLLKECMKQNNVNMAVGEIWREKYQTGLDTLLQESERECMQIKQHIIKEPELIAENSRYSGVSKVLSSDGTFLWLFYKRENKNIKKYLTKRKCYGNILSCPRNINVLKIRTIYGKV